MSGPTAIAGISNRPSFVAAHLGRARLTASGVTANLGCCSDDHALDRLIPRRRKASHDVADAGECYCNGPIGVPLEFGVGSSGIGHPGTRDRDCLGSKAWCIDTNLVWHEAGNDSMPLGIGCGRKGEAERFRNRNIARAAWNDPGLGEWASGRIQHGDLGI